MTKRSEETALPPCPHWCLADHQQLVGPHHHEGCVGVILREIDLDAPVVYLSQRHDAAEPSVMTGSLFGGQNMSFTPAEADRLAELVVRAASWAREGAV